MSSFPVKLVALFFLLSLGVSLATSTLLPYGDHKKSLTHVFDCNGVLRRNIVRKVGKFGCENKEVVQHKPVSYRSLRSLPYIPPPSPIKNRQKAMKGDAPPPLVA